MVKKIARTRDDAKEPGAYSVPLDSPLGQELVSLRSVTRTGKRATDLHETLEESMPCRDCGNARPAGNGNVSRLCATCDLKHAAKLASAVGFMVVLAHKFPTLRDADGVCPWDAEKLDAWACGPKRTGGGWHAAMFVLSVWRPHAQWRCGRFSAALAMQVWDEHHRAAFAAWASAGGHTP